MLDRLLVTGLVLAGLGLLWLGWYYYKARLLERIETGRQPAGKPALLYFTGAYCAACKYQQTPIVERIAASFGDSLVVQKYDVSEYPELAQRYKVITLPTTLVLDRQGRVVHLNYGLASQAKLEQQLAGSANLAPRQPAVFEKLQPVA